MYIYAYKASLILANCSMCVRKQQCKLHDIYTLCTIVSINAQKFTSNPPNCKNLYFKPKKYTHNLHTHYAKSNNLRKRKEARFEKLMVKNEILTEIYANLQSYGNLRKSAKLYGCV